MQLKSGFKMVLFCCFLVCGYSLSAQVFTGSSLRKSDHYECRLKINPDSTVIFTYNNLDNFVYAAHEGKIRKVNDTLFHISAVMTLGKFDVMRLAIYDTLSHVTNDTVYFGLDSVENKLVDVKEIRYSNGSTVNYQNELKKRNRPYFPLDGKLLTQKKGTRTYIIVSNTLDKITGKALAFKSGFYSQPGFVAGDKLELDVGIRGNVLWSLEKKSIQTGSFRLKKVETKTR